MLRKLQHYGIRGHGLKWFSRYLSNRQHYIQYNGVSSDKLKIVCGVPQGSILGPLLFLLYINDLPNSLRKLIIIMFADDATTYASLQNIVNLTESEERDLCQICSFRQII